MRNIYSPEFSRNYGFWNETEQELLNNAKVAIAGVGGDGFQLGIKLAEIGVQKFSIADPEIFEPENANRVIGATTATYGEKKADIFLNKIMEINPEAEVTIFSEGVNEDNIEEFIMDSSIVLDESELTKLEIGTMIAREARKQNIPDLLVMNIGFAAIATSFNPDSKITFEKVMGLKDNMPLDEINGQPFKLNHCLPYLPSYGDLETLRAVSFGAPLPSIAQGVDVASALGATQTFLHLTKQAKNKRPEPIWAPKFGFIDAYSLKSGEIKFPRINYYAKLGSLVLKNIININPKASYSETNRQSRNQ